MKNESIKDYIDKEVVRGIRPENIKSKPVKAGTNFHKQQAKVTALEQMGNEVLVYSQLGKNQVIARFSPEAEVQIESSTDLHFNLEKIQFFDPVTEAVIN